MHCPIFPEHVDAEQCNTLGRELRYAPFPPVIATLEPYLGHGNQILVKRGLW